jgi:histidinol-phosphate aminotransferase
LAVLAPWRFNGKKHAFTPMTDNRLQALIARWIRADVRNMTAYHVADAAHMVKLDAMENPYGWPHDMQEDWLTVLRKVALNRYPDPTAKAVKNQLRDVMEVPPDAAVILGNGSDELIQLIAMAVADAGRTIVAPEPGFAMYRLIATAVGMRYQGVALTPDFSLDMPAIRAAIDAVQPAVIFLAYPNNPTGNLFAEADMREIIETAPGLVVVDEAYHVFAGHTFMDLLTDYANLLVMRTVSKMGLAGLRLGILAGAPAWIAELEKLRLPYNINVLTQASVEFALAYSDVLTEQAERIRADRDSLYQALTQLLGITAYPSDANFILFRTGNGRATAIFEGLRERGVLIKNLHGSHPALHDCLRVTVGTEDENAAFLNALMALL